MWLGNQAARPVRYEKKEWADYKSRKSLSSTTMIYSGLVIFLFVIVHLKQFKFGALYQIGDPPIRDLYRTEVEVFSAPIWVAIYVICVLLVGLHLRHGISSAFQSIGVDHPVYTRRLLVWGTVLAIVIGVGFAVIPLWVFFTR
jgi:succinate dehydrogenase / fumarate reductase cytochrome b subunit